MAEFSELLGKTLTEIREHDDNSCLEFFTDSNQQYNMFHDQDCCEHVYVEDICGDLNDLLNSPILLAEKVTEDHRSGTSDVDTDEDYAWTFYKLSTLKGSITIRWYGSSNGYYSIDVGFYEVDKEDEVGP